MANDTITVYRPVGEAELALIRATDYHAFPLRLHWQPIFYPVLQEDYAIQIARDWNTKDEASGYVGYVTRFEVRADFLAAYTVQNAGSSSHQEYWIPAADVIAFNENIVGLIEVIHTFLPEE